MNDPTIRKRLDELPAKGEEMDPEFRNMIDLSKDFDKGLLQLFFDDDPLLASLIRQYGIF
jgi:hypothetical protein